MPLAPAVPEPLALPEAVPDVVPEPVAEEVVSLLAPLRVLVELEDGVLDVDPDELLLGLVDFG